MIERAVFLKSVCDVRRFVAAAEKCGFDVDLVSGRFRVDGKSVMGIFSLDLSRGMTVCIHAPEADEFLREIAFCLV